MKDQWLEGCGTCPGETRSINLTLHFVKEDPACKQARFHGVMTEAYSGRTDGVRVRAKVAEQLGWCGCGDNGRVDELMLAYLTHKEVYRTWSDTHSGTNWVKVDWTQAPKNEQSAEVQLLLAYIADDLGWTEHGSSVNASWLTDDGKEALANLRKPEIQELEGT